MSRAEAIKTRLEEYNTLSGLLKNKSSEIAPNGRVMVYLGDGYFTEMNLESAQEYVQSRVSTLESQYQSILYSEGVNEEGLPIMDIHEELDDDGNVVNSTVERTGGSADQIKKALSGMRQAQQENQPPSQLSQAPRITEISSELHKPEQQEVQREIEAGDMEVDEEPPVQPAVQDITEKITKSKTEANETPSGVGGPAPNFHGISRDDMLELQLLGDELEDMQVKLNEDEQSEEFDEDYEMEYDDDASEESDEDEFGRSRGSLFPSDSRTVALLEKHLAQKKKPSGAHKSVSFSPSLEVKEFETTSAERKGQVDDPESEQPEPPLTHSSAVDFPSQPEEPKKPKTSLFRQRMGAKGFTHQRKTDRPATSDIVENFTASSNSAPTQEKVPEKPNSAPGTESRALPSANARPTTYSSLDRPVPGRSYTPASGKKNARPITLPTSNTAVPAEFVQYVNDPDEITLKDLEPDALQYFNDATIPDDDFLALYDKPDLDMSESNNADNEDDRPVSSQIVERMPEHKPDDRDSDMNEIRNEYQRLRQKLVYKAGGYKKTDSDQATQEVDEDGNPVKVSRFRAARTSMR